MKTEKCKICGTEIERKGRGASRNTATCAGPNGGARRSGKPTTKRKNKERRRRQCTSWRLRAAFDGCAFKGTGTVQHKAQADGGWHR